MKVRARHLTAVDENTATRARFTGFVDDLTAPIPADVLDQLRELEDRQATADNDYDIATEALDLARDLLEEARMAFADAEAAWSEAGAAMNDAAVNLSRARRAAGVARTADGYVRETPR